MLSKKVETAPRRIEHRVIESPRYVMAASVNLALAKEHAGITQQRVPLFKLVEERKPLRVFSHHHVCITDRCGYSSLANIGWRTVTKFFLQRFVWFTHREHRHGN